MRGYRKLKEIEHQYSFIKLTPFIYLGILIGIILQLLELIPTIILQQMIDLFLPNQQMGLFQLDFAVNYRADYCRNADTLPKGHD